MPPLYSDNHDVSDEFASAVCNLPIDYDKAEYKKFLDVWGTVSIGNIYQFDVLSRFEIFMSMQLVMSLFYFYFLGVSTYGINVINV